MLGREATLYREEALPFRSTTVDMVHVPEVNPSIDIGYFAIETLKVARKILTGLLENVFIHGLVSSLETLLRPGFTSEDIPSSIGGK